jgi:hypothetical protein
LTALAILLASACVSAPVSYGPPPERGAPPIPWIRSGVVIGHLFYYGVNGPWKVQPERVIVPTHGVSGPGSSTKVLWHVRGGYGHVRISGQRLDGAGRFTQTYKGIPGGYFPSYLIVPAAGCWRVVVASAGHRASFAFAAVDL